MQNSKTNTVLLVILILLVGAGLFMMYDKRENENPDISNSESEEVKTLLMSLPSNEEKKLISSNVTWASASSNGGKTFHTYLGYSFSDSETETKPLPDVRAILVGKGFHTNSDNVGDATISSHAAYTNGTIVCDISTFSYDLLREAINPLNNEDIKRGKGTTIACAYMKDPLPENNN